MTTEDLGAVQAGEHGDQSIDVGVARYVRLDLSGLEVRDDEVRLTATGARALAERLTAAAATLDGG